LRPGTGLNAAPGSRLPYQIFERTFKIYVKSRWRQEIGNPTPQRPIPGVRSAAQRHRDEKLGLVFDRGMEYLTAMNVVERAVAVGFGGILLAVTARADVTERAVNPYHVIIDRNPFGLRPPPAPPTNAPPTTPPVVVTVKFTGITSDSTGRKAWLVIPPQPNKNPNPQYLSIAEHEKQGDIEVLDIDEKEGTVKILNAGQAFELNFKDHGLQTPPPAAVPGIQYPRAVPPGALPTGIVPAPGTPSPGIRTAGATPTVSAHDAMAARYGLQPSTTANAALQTIPARNVRTTPGEAQAPAAGATVDPAVQRVLMEAQKAQAEREGHSFPPLPPLPFR